MLRVAICAKPIMAAATIQRNKHRIRDRKFADLDKDIRLKWNPLLLFRHVSRLDVGPWQPGLAQPPDRGGKTTAAEHRDN